MTHTAIGLVTCDDDDVAEVQRQARLIKDHAASRGYTLAFTVGRAWRRSSRFRDVGDCAHHYGATTVIVSERCASGPDGFAFFESCVKAYGATVDVASGDCNHNDGDCESWLHALADAIPDRLEIRSFP